LLAAADLLLKKDSLAKIIVEITQSRQSIEISLRCAAFYLVNPSDASWKTLIPTIQNYYVVDPVDLSSWLESLEGFSNPTESDL
jgi:hypothetical protein